MRVLDLVPALVEREQRAHAEQHEGDDERVEVAVTPVAERVPLVRLAGTALLADEQQHLVARVGDRVHRFREQRRRRRDEEAGELRSGDGEVCPERRDDGLLPTTGTHSDIRLRSRSLRDARSFVARPRALIGRFAPSAT